ncbi:MAG: type IV secretory system conjugative DNA transfer family protein [Oscillospiraceae bacterium]|nr:type IV secretory system conjugative DNA transfer family protein [Oscillospiraceae bacterium]
MTTSQIALLVLCALAFMTIGALILFGDNYNLNRIKNKTVGDGQHGTARFAAKSEIKRAYRFVPYRAKLWREGEMLPSEQGLIVGSVKKAGGITALVDSADVHALMIGASGIGKTAYFLYPNIEYACACGMSFISTDTKGDVYRNTAPVARDKYGYNISVIDLRNPTRSDEFNMLYLVNKYMDLFKDSGNLSHKAKAEKYAKILAKTVVNAGVEAGSYGQNAYFYEAAEGLLTSTVLLVAEFCEPSKRHIISVFKLIQDLIGPSQVKGKNNFQRIVEMLPPEHKARWFAGAALNTSDQAMASVLSTALSRLNAFLDSELEQILCFGTSIDIERFCNEKSAIYLVLPEEDTTKHFLVSLMLQQFYREMMTVADENGGKLNNRVMMFCDELGTLPKIESLDMMFSASRSRKISIVAIIQSLAQFEKTYGREGAEIIADNCQLTIFGGFAPNSKTAETLSKNLGSYTVMSGSVSKGRGEPSEQLQMMKRELMTPDELKSMDKGSFVVMKTGFNPMRTKLPLFTEWGLTFDEQYTVPEKSARKVEYANKEELVKAINSASTN